MSIVYDFESGNDIHFSGNDFLAVVSIWLISVSPKFGFGFGALSMAVAVFGPLGWTGIGPFLLVVPVLWLFRHGYLRIGFAYILVCLGIGAISISRLNKALIVSTTLSSLFYAVMCAVAGFSIYLYQAKVKSQAFDFAKQQLADQEEALRYRKQAAEHIHDSTARSLGHALSLLETAAKDGQMPERYAEALSEGREAMNSLRQAIAILNDGESFRRWVLARMPYRPLFSTGLRRYSFLDIT